jgi:threonine dehydrogenase-like Zn-dependent dehydrogenase
VPPSCSCAAAAVVAAVVNGFCDREAFVRLPGGDLYLLKSVLFDWPDPEAIAILRRGGKMALFGLPDGPVSMDLAEGVIFKGLTVLGINGREVFNTWEEMLPLLAEKRVDPRPVTTHKFKLADFVKAMETGIDPNVDSGKIVLTP